ncbi:MAG: triphosphoribosyl-dephospho-CoA synthetase [Planctomycetaceae bacterium]|nr:triphosphoribosyl-dephospho-CoA synthetase [Planctomycetaceae bacterium]
MTRSTTELTEQIHLACLLEASARKPGNVHPNASFHDLEYADFVRSADIIAPILASPTPEGLGTKILAAVTATQQERHRNTNLGMVLLLAPLAAVPREQHLQEGITDVLQATTRQDAALVYEAIRVANPGGMGRVDEQDLSMQPEGTLVEVMRLAAERDLVAAEYASAFDITVETGAPFLSQLENFVEHWEAMIVTLQLILMRDHPDTLIARKCGAETAIECSRRARAALKAGGLGSTLGREQIAQLDKWLRSDDNRRNPGTTADLIAAALFAAIREGMIVPPSVEEIQRDVSQMQDEGPWLTSDTQSA